MENMTVGDVANVVGVSTKAVRLWEAKGLIAGVKRTPAGYRLYDAGHVATARFIQQAKTLGMTLGEIGRILELRQNDHAPCDRVTRMLDERIAGIDRSIDALKHLRTTLLNAKQRADATTPETGTHIVVCPIIEWPEDATSDWRLG